MRRRGELQREDRRRSTQIFGEFPCEREQLLAKLTGCARAGG
jgi:hypothetical protein